MQNNNGTTDKATEKETLMNKILGAISGSFAPILGVLAGSGLISALLSILKSLGWISAESGTYAILSAAGHAVFYFFPIFLGYTMANKLGANGFVGAAIGAALLEPNYVNLVTSQAQDVSFLGIPVLLASYSSTVFPIVIAASIYAALDKVLRKVVYKELQMFINPMISLLVIVPLTILIFGPFGTYVGEALSVSIQFLSDKSGILTGAVLGAAWSFLTILGLHWAVIPIFLANLAATGFDPIIAMVAAAPFAQIGMGLGVFFKTKDTKLKTLAGSGLLPSALAGTTEIITYGLLVRYKRTMLIVGVSGAIGGAIIGALGVTGTAFALPSFLSIPVFTPIPLFLVGVLTSLVLAMVLTLVFGYEGKNDQAVTSNKEFGLEKVRKETISSPLTGNIIPLNELSEPLFSTETIGKGIAIEPTKGDIISPVDGVVTTLFPSKHASGITSDDGAEILIYIGENTINLNGKFFTSHVKQWDKVKKGDLLIEFDIEKIRAEGYDIKSPIIVTNTEAYLGVEPVHLGNVKASDALLKLDA